MSFFSNLFGKKAAGHPNVMTMTTVMMGDVKLRMAGKGKATLDRGDVPKINLSSGIPEYPII